MEKNKKWAFFFTCTVMVASWYFIWGCISMIHIFHGPLTSDFGQIIKVKIFVQVRILSSTNGSRLIFYMRMYLYETSRNMQEPWPIFQGLLTSDFGQFSIIGRFLSSVDILLGALPLWDQQSLLSFQEFMLRGGSRGQYLGHHRFCLMSWRLVDGWILYLRCWFSVTQTLTWIYVYRSVTYFMVQWFCLIPWRLFAGQMP